MDTTENIIVKIEVNHIKIKWIFVQVDFLDLMDFYNLENNDDDITYNNIIVVLEKEKLFYDGREKADENIIELVQKDRPEAIAVRIVAGDDMITEIHGSRQPGNETSVGVILIFKIAEKTQNINDNDK